MAKKYDNAMDEGDDVEEQQQILLDPSGLNPYFDKKITSRRNDIFLYKEVDEDLARELIDQLEAMYLNIIQVCITLGMCEKPYINLHICSPGGTVDQAFAIIEVMENIKHGLKPFNIPMDINTYIEGNADSAASLIACCGSKRYISKYAGCVIHGMSSGAVGKVKDIYTVSDNLKDIEKIYVDIYCSHSKLTKEEMAAIMKEEKRYTPEWMLEKGLVDEITKTF